MELGVTTQIDPNNPYLGDLAIDDTGQEVRLTDVPSETAQRLHIRLRFFKREWLLDVQEGMPLLEQIFRKGVSGSTIQAVYRERISGTRGIAQVAELTHGLDKANRELHVGGTMILTDGSVLRFHQGDTGWAAETVFVTDNYNNPLYDSDLEDAVVL